MTPDIQLSTNNQLSPHFSLRELTHSDTAYRLGIDNSLDPSNPKHLPIIDNLRNLCIHVLEPLRTFAKVPIHINSGYRCTALNKAVGGVSNSQHMAGKAADIHLPSIEVGRLWFNYLKTIDHDQLIWETNAKGVSWIHVSYSSFINTTIIPTSVYGGGGRCRPKVA